MSARIYLGNISFSTTEQDLTDLCASFGAVKSATVARDRTGTRSRGFGFVEFVDAANATAAVAGLNGTELEGRELRVEAEKPKSEEERAVQRERRRVQTKERRAAAIAAAQSGESKAELTLRAYVGNLPYDTTADELAGLFSGVAGFVDVELAADSNGAKGFGYAEFDSEENLLAAIAAKADSVLSGRTLDVQREMPKLPRRARRPRRRGAKAGAGGAGAGDAAAAAPAPAPIENNPSKVYVGNVPFSLTEEELTDAFAEFGAITEVSIPTASSGRRLGFAYVTFDSPDAAAAAVDARNETDLGGRAIKVELENRKPKAAKKRRGPRRGGSRRRRTPEEDEA